jgi:hypothetical protein
MLYLGQVSQDSVTQVPQIVLLAHQRSDYLWSRIADGDRLSAEGVVQAVGCLVLVEVGDDRQVLEVKDATGWVLELVQDFLSSGTTPDSLRQETERAEQWRQHLTLQSQDLGRRTLELEARMGQIQELEERLQHEKSSP